MTDEQLDLDGRLVPVGVKLTERQRLALDYVRAHGPVASDELGALLHEERQARGGRGHHRDLRCDWCGDEGSSMGKRLRELGLVRKRTGESGGWYVPDSRGPDRESADRTAQLGAGDAWPEGF